MESSKLLEVQEKVCIACGTVRPGTMVCLKWGQYARVLAHTCKCGIKTTIIKERLCKCDTSEFVLTKVELEAIK